MLDLSTFLIFCGLLVAVGWRRAASAESYVVAGRTLGLVPLVATLVMTEFNTSTLLAFAASGYSAGPMAIALPMVFLVGLAFYTGTVARPWKRFNRTSVAELFTVRYSRSLGRAASALLLLAMIGFTATYVKSMTLLFVPFVPAELPRPLLSALLTGVVLAAVLPGGLVSVVRADVIGFFASLVVFPAAFWFSWRAGEAAGLASVFPADQRALAIAAQWSHPALPMRFVFTLVILTCFTYIAAPWYGQKMFAAKDEQTARRAAGISAVLVFVLYGVMVLAASWLRVTFPQLEDPQLAVPTLFSELLPAGLRGVGFAMLFGAALTTLAGVWSAMAAMVAADFTVTSGNTVRRQRGWILFFALCSWTGATFLVDDILNRLILANIPVAALSFALLAGFHWPRATTAGAWASVMVGFLWGVGCFIVVGEAGGYTWPWAVYGIPLIMVTGVVVSLLTGGRVAVPESSATPQTST